MTVTDFLSPGWLSLLALAAAALIEVRFRRLFATKEDVKKDVDGLGRKVNELDGAFHATAALANNAVGDLNLIRQRHEDHWERMEAFISEQVRETRQLRQDFNTWATKQGEFGAVIQGLRTDVDRLEKRKADR